ncbi:DUF485 domain-containing protein [Streptomyces sp. CNQ085]|uniref:DUF485 domain-containing protein n=1 Tax=Streptomyces sp. CNQ085 TaxID=2886944 RepID=UPI001F509ED4|nr:DUF485 domain-containing protein [Streptomyces sp. CNQ085]MCI0382929.1 DUF485 domain-containing protein [Streptomyces sp. CNQ085]
MRIDDPWYDPLASGWEKDRGATAAPFPRPPGPGTVPASAARARGTACRGTRRRLLLSAVAALLVCHLAYLVAVTAAPAVVARTPGGPVTVDTAAGLAQLTAVCLLARAYARHTRPHRNGHGAARGPGGCGRDPCRAAGAEVPGRAGRTR